MLLPAMRPVFRRMVDVPMEVVADAVRDGLERNALGVVGSVSGSVIELYLTRAQRHVYSPRLSVVLYAREKTLVVGRYGPIPDIWTFLVAAYALCAFAVLGGAVGWAAQYLVGTPSSVWIAIPVGLVGAIVVYCTALVGRHLARDQVTALETFFLQCLDATDRGRPA